MLGSYLARVVDKDIETCRVIIQIELDLLNSQVNVLLDAKAKVAVVGEVLLPQLILLHLEASLKNLLSLFKQMSTQWIHLPRLICSLQVYQLAVLCLIILIRRKMVMRTIIMN